MAPDQPRPTDTEVRAELDRIIGSDTFRGSPQLAAFLRFVVEAVLRGKAERIKGYTIGVEVLRRDVSFDPQLDPIVRVEATRLRRAMDRYYAGPGADDRVGIELPRGTYAPVFTFRDRALPGVASLTSNPRLTLAAAGGALLVALLLFLVARPWQPPASASNGMPTVAVAPFETTGTPRPNAIAAPALRDKIGAAFSRFDTINVAAPAPGTAAVMANYRLQGRFDYADDGSVSAQFGLLDLATNTLIWSRAFDRMLPVGDRSAAEDMIVLELAATLLQPFGVIRANELSRQLAGAASDPRYRCILTASESLRSFAVAEHDKARDCLEKLTAADPSFGIGLSYLAAIEYREFQYGLPVRPGDKPALDRALIAARRAVELKPESALGYQMLFTVLFARRDQPGAFAAGDRALALNRYDMTIVSDYGGRLIMAGEVDRGLGMLSRAAQYGSVRPSWYNFYLFLAYYLKGDLKQATHYSDQMTGDAYSLGLVARALSAHANGDAARAREALERLVALEPAWSPDPRPQLDKFFPRADIAARLARDLAAAGLPANKS